METGFGTISKINNKFLEIDNQGKKSVLNLGSCSRMESVQPIPKIGQKIYFRGTKTQNNFYNVYKASCLWSDLFIYCYNTNIVSKKLVFLINIRKLSLLILYNFYFDHINCSLHPSSNHKIFVIKLIEVQGQWNSLKIQASYNLTPLKYFNFVYWVESCCI